MRVFGPGPTRIGVSSAHSTPAVMTRARISMFTPADRLRGAGDHRVDEPVRRAGPGQRLDDPRAPLDRDVVHDQQEHGPGLQVQPVGHRPGLPGPGRRRRGMHPPAPAGDRVPVVLRDRRGHRRGVDDLVRRGDAEVLRVRQVPRRTRTPLREQRLPLVRVLAPGQVRARRPALLPLPSLPVPRLGLGSGAVFPGRSSADGGIPEFPEFRDTARSSFASRSASSVTCAASSAFRASRTSISTPWTSASTARSSSAADAVTARPSFPAGTPPRHANPLTAAQT